MDEAEKIMRLLSAGWVWNKSGPSDPNICQRTGMVALGPTESFRLAGRLGDENLHTAIRAMQGKTVLQLSLF